MSEAIHDRAPEDEKASPLAPPPVVPSRPPDERPSISGLRRRPLVHGFYGYVRQNRGLLEKAILASVLPGVAGSMNASGFFALGIYTSHMTGMTAKIGDELARSHFASAFELIGFLGCFFGGAALSSLLVDLGRDRRRGRYVLPLVVEAMTLTAFVLTAWDFGHPNAMRIAQATGLLCFAMGLQNALVTKISGAVVRTTHMTGIVTDIGIESVHVVRWYAHRLRGHGLRAWFRSLGTLVDDPEFDRLRLHLAIYCSFISGAVVGPVLYLFYGIYSMMLPVAVVVALAVFDASFGIRTGHGAVRPRPA